jgi:hypothetical protein
VINQPTLCLTRLYGNELLVGEVLGHSQGELLGLAFFLGTWSLARRKERGTTLTQPKLMGNKLELSQGELLLGLALVDELVLLLEEEKVGGTRLDSN